MAAEQVLAQEHLALAALEAPEVQLLAAQLDESGLERDDPVGGHEHLAVADPRLDAAHRRVAPVGEPDDQVVDPPEPLAGAIDEAAPDERGKVDERNLHSSRSLGDGAAAATKSSRQRPAVRARGRCGRRYLRA